MTTISAKTVLRSRNTSKPDKVLSTLLCHYPRWIHAEGKTHRLLYISEDFGIWLPNPSPMDDKALSRNAASSRAIPVRKMIDAIRLDPAVPLFWGKNVAGMQAKEELPPHLKLRARDIWIRAMEAAIGFAEQMVWLDNEDPETQHIGAHKQIVNRILEPYMHITVLYSATEWNNFLALRDHADAEPHIAMLAREVKRELERADNIQDLHPGQWHLPFVDESDYYDAKKASDNPEFGGDPMMDLLVPKSTACCASTSYKTVDGFDMTMDRAVALHDKLVSSTPLHASPCEHVAQADQWDEVFVSEWQYPEQHGNFVGFRQYRKMLPGEFVPG